MLFQRSQRADEQTQLSSEAGDADPGVGRWRRLTAMRLATSASTCPALRNRPP